MPEPFVICHLSSVICELNERPCAVKRTDNAGVYVYFVLEKMGSLLWCLALLIAVGPGQVTSTLMGWSLCDVEPIPHGMEGIVLKAYEDKVANWWSGKKQASYYVNMLPLLPTLPRYLQAGSKDSEAVYGRWDRPNEPVQVWNASEFQSSSKFSSHFGEKMRTYTGPHLIFHALFPRNYGHCLHDHLPWLAWLAKNNKKIRRGELPVLVESSPISQTMWEWMYPQLYRRLTFVRSRELFKIVKGAVTVVDTSPRFRHPRLVNAFAEMVRTHVPPSNHPPAVIWYSRKSGNNDLLHGRVMDAAHEQDALQIIRELMSKHSRPERLVVFDGKNHSATPNENGTFPTMTLVEQYELFNSANVIVGPHGMGMANIMWTRSNHSNTTCHERPKVLEIITSPLTKSVHDGDIRRTTYLLTSLIPWVEYHHMPYAANSTEGTTFIDLSIFRSAMDGIFSTSPAV